MLRAPPTALYPSRRVTLFLKQTSSYSSSQTAINHRASTTLYSGLAVRGIVVIRSWYEPRPLAVCGPRRTCAITRPHQHFAETDGSSYSYWRCAIPALACLLQVGASSETASSFPRAVRKPPSVGAWTNIRCRLAGPSRGSDLSCEHEHEHPDSPHRRRRIRCLLAVRRSPAQVRLKTLELSPCHGMIRSPRRRRALSI